MMISTANWTDIKRYQMLSVRPPSFPSLKKLKKKREKNISTNKSYDFRKKNDKKKTFLNQSNKWRKKKNREPQKYFINEKLYSNNLWIVYKKKLKIK